METLARDQKRQLIHVRSKLRLVMHKRELAHSLLLYRLAPFTVIYFLFAQQKNLKNFCNSIEGKPSFSMQRETLNQTAVYTKLFSATEAAA